MASPCFHALPATPKSPDAVSGVQTSRDGASAPLSFAAAAAAGKPRLVPRFRPVDIPARQYTSIDGKPSIAKFTMGRPSTEEIRRVFKENWPVKGRATVSDIWDSRHLMIILDSEEDAKVALTSQLRKVGHAMFRLFRYYPDYNPRRESTTTTKWVRLPGLHPGFVTRNYVAGIVNSFGHFLDLDDRTKACSSLRFARACVEIDVSKSIPEEVRITLSDGRIFWQKIEIEGNLSFCSHCNIHGHIIADCWKKTPKNRDQSSLSADRETHIGGESRPTEVYISNGHGYKGSTPTLQKTQEEWIQVKRKKGARTVSFQNVEGMKKHITTAQAPPNVTVIGSQSTNEAILDGGAVTVVNEIKETGYEVGDLALVVFESDRQEMGDRSLDDVAIIVETSQNAGVDSDLILNDEVEEQEEEEDIDKRLSIKLHLSEETAQKVASYVLSEETAQKVSSYGDLIYCSELGYQVDPKAVYMLMREAGEDESFIFECLDDYVNENRQVQQDDSGTHFEESEIHDDQVESVDPPPPP